MTGIGPKITELKERRSWSTTKLATLAGISQSFLWRLENGTATGSWGTYEKIAGALGVSMDVFFPNKSNVEDAHVGWRRIPVLDYSQAGQWTSVDGNPKFEEIRETIMTDLEYPVDTFALRIRGDSMEPEFTEGDIVVIVPSIEPKPGDYVVASDGSGKTVFRRYRDAGINTKGKGVFELYPLNALYGPMRSDRQKLTLHGVMVEHRTFRKS